MNPESWTQLSGFIMKRKCSLEEKLEAIALVEQGMSARSVSDKLHLGHHILFMVLLGLMVVPYNLSLYNQE